VQGTIDNLIHRGNGNGESNGDGKLGEFLSANLTVVIVS
jgi:hypothetical protein